MRLTRYFLPTLKETPAEAQIVSHRYMLRTGMARHRRRQERALTIGVSQFAAALHPSIKAAVAKSIVLDMARRPPDPDLVVRQARLGHHQTVSRPHMGNPG